MQSIPDPEDAGKSGVPGQSTPDSSNNVLWQGFPLAGWMRRLVAFLTDLMVALGSTVVAILGLLIVMGDLSSDLLAKEFGHAWAWKMLREEMGWGLFFFGATAMLTYGIWFLVALGRGQTPGKQVAGIRALRPNGASSGWGHISSLRRTRS